MYLLYVSSKLDVVFSYNKILEQDKI